MIQEPNSGYWAEENKNIPSKWYLYPHVYCSIIYNSHGMEAS